ncbi:hypothetical protein ACFZAR_36175 [Streptomyces sp. NPDC008222]|uniref:hypothetical protein n=1 Tax=Streptomyces sp. NPDC008222 TaxID=3364820 RepID=UPI0036E565E9
MTALALYLTVVLTGSAGLLGHTPILSRLTRQALAWRARTPSRDTRAAEAPPGPPQRRPRPAPSWARPDPDQYEEAA